MYVIRQTIHVKTGRMQEFLALQMESWKQSGATFYLPQTGPLEIFEVEYEFESYAALDETMARFAKMAKTFPKSEQLDKQDDLIVSITNQTWYKE
jgi:hypothetical protein